MTRLDLTTYASWVGMAILVLGFWLWIGANVWLIGSGLLQDAGRLNGCEAYRDEIVACAEMGGR